MEARRNLRSCHSRDAKRINAAVPYTKVDLAELSFKFRAFSARLNDADSRERSLYDERGQAVRTGAHLGTGQFSALAHVQLAAPSSIPGITRNSADRPNEMKAI